MPRDLGPQGGGIAPLPSGLGLLLIVPPHPLHLPVTALAGFDKHLRQPRLGLLKLQRLTVGKGGITLPHVLADYAVDQQVGKLRHCRVTVAVKRILINAPHVVQHLAHAQQLVAGVDDGAGEIALAEHLRQLTVRHIHVKAAHVADFQRPPVGSAPVLEIRNRAVIGIPQRDVFQVVADGQQLPAALRLHQHPVDDLLRRRSGMGTQGVHGYVVGHQRLAQRRHVALNGAVVGAAAVVGKEPLSQLLHVAGAHAGRLGAPQLPAPLGHALRQHTVPVFQRPPLLLQLPHLTLQFRGGFQLEADIGISGGIEVVHVLDLLRPERHRLRVHDKAVVACTVYLVEQLHRRHHVADGRLAHVIQHKEVAFPVKGAQHTVNRRTIAIVLKAEIVLILGNSRKEPAHLRSGDGGLCGGYRIGDVQIELPHIAILSGVGLAVREVEAAPVQIAAL